MNREALPFIINQTGSVKTKGISDKMSMQPYDAKKDIGILSENMRKWASLGFMRGFAGLRSELFPIGQTTLASAAFLEVAQHQMTAGSPDVDEQARRKAYIEAVEGGLRECQVDSVHRHHLHAILGQIADLLMAMALLAIIFGLIYVKGAFHPLTLTFISLLAVKILFMHWTIRKIVNVAKAAFMTNSDDIKLPWIERP